MELAKPENTVLLKAAQNPPTEISVRDRFVAFAFCWADILLELDADKTIIFAGGPTVALTGKTPEQLIGTTFYDLVAQPDTTLANELMKVAEKHGRIENVTIRLAWENGSTVPMAFAGYRMDDLDGRYFLALRSATGTIVGTDGRKFMRNAKSGLYDGQGFGELASQRLQAAQQNGKVAEMTLVSLPNYDDLQERLDEETKESLINTFSMALRANSIGGDSAAQIDTGKFALVHDGDLNVGELEEHLSAVTKNADPDGVGVKAETATIDTGDRELDNEDLANGLVYLINQFKVAKGSEFSLKNFSTNLTSMIGEAISSVKSFKEVLRASEFDIAFHPILDAKTCKINHYEALVRFHHAKNGESPYQFITFAEEVGLIWQFDIAMARMVINWLSKRRDKNYSIAINISGHSITNVEYLSELHQLLKTNFWARGRILFEITESARISDLPAANRIFQKLRQEGYKICLDDFGAGAASFEYLSTLEVDVVKLDGGAVKNALVAKKGPAFLAALTKLCKDMDVVTVAEMVDDEKTLKFVRKCGVDYVQGYLFGKPALDIAVFETIPNAAELARIPVQ